MHLAPVSAHYIKAVYLKTESSLWLAEHSEE